MKVYAAAPDQSDEIWIAADTDVPVLLTADAAADRERCARLIHGGSGDPNRPFVAIHSDAPGSAGGANVLGQRFEQARGGTLFIEDLATLAPEAQQLLFVLLEERSDRGLVHAVRILAGVSGGLDAQRASGAFSEALFYRLNILNVDAHLGASEPKLQQV
jgi:DNA-binding NtrC family response regulator